MLFLFIFILLLCAKVILYHRSYPDSQPNNFVKDIERWYSDLPVVISSHAFFIHWAIKFFSIWKNSLMMDDDSFDYLIHVCLTRHLVLYVWNRHQGWPKTNGQVVRIHHVFITVLWKAVVTEKSRKTDFSTVTNLILKTGETLFSITT